ncbi:MAG: sel1 repeat family protein [Bacteroidetes bacterium]|nr:sel1 repeat family protein [Bacteroidota bacterium]MBL7104841.1 sel1 repeat family protein [Bacteroidales bacterium]
MHAFFRYQYIRINWSWYHFYRSRYYQGWDGAAIEYYQKAINKGIDEALIKLANIYTEINRKKEAEKLYLKAIDTGDINGLNNLANLYSDSGNNKYAEKFYLKAIKSGNIDAIYNLGLHYTNIDQMSKAEKYFQLAIDKGNIDALNSLALMYYYTNQKRKKAVELIEKYIAKNNDIFGLLSYVRILLWAGKMEIFETQVQKLVPELIKNNNSNKLAILFIEFLVHKQYYLALQLFKDHNIGNQLKDMIKPLYYVTVGFIPGAEYVEELLKPGRELEENIKQFKEYIQEKQKVYY